MVTASSSYQKQRQCHESGMCSLGLTERWNGDIRPSDSLHAFLDAVTYKKELILICYQRYQNYLEESAIHMHYELENLGFGHHAFMGFVGDVIDQDGNVTFVDSCSDLTSIAPSISCVWDSTPIPDWILTGEDRLWHYRWKMMARSIRLGYNVLSVDLDTMFFRGDFYGWIKQPPLKDMNMICNPEDGPANYPSYYCNGGWIYVQNVRPDGPVAWVWKEVVWNLLRRADDHYEYLGPFCKEKTGACYEQRLEKRNCQTFDQSWIYDAVISAAAGLRLSPNLAAVCKEGYNFTNKLGEVVNTSMVMETILAIADPHSRMNESQELPDSILQSIGLDADHIPDLDRSFSHGFLTVPNLAYGFPEILGGRGWPDGPQGNYSLDFENMLKEDCPKCPWWKEERPLDESIKLELIQLKGQQRLVIPTDPDIKPERFALTPKWLSSGLLVARRGTIVGLNSNRQGYPAMGHIHRWLTLNGGFYYKLDSRKLYGRYNWTVGAALKEKYGYASVYASGRLGFESSRLLALSPSIDLARTRSWEEVANIILGLFEVARLSNRVALIPQIPCKSPWLRGLDLSDDAISALYGTARTSTVHLILEALNALRRNTCHGLELQSDETEMDVFFPVDAKGELIGGWARKLLKRRDHMHSHDILDPFWRSHRHSVADLYMFSEFCIQMPAMLPPEFFHWLKHDEVGKEAKAEPDKSNTVFLVSEDDSELQLQPPVSNATKGVLTASSDQGWSWHDVTVKLPSADVLREMDKLKSVPLVYMGHPVLVSLDSKRMKEFAKSIIQSMGSGEVCPLLLKEKWAENQTDQVVFVTGMFHHGISGRIDDAGWVEVDTESIKKGLSGEDIQKLFSIDI